MSNPGPYIYKSFGRLIGYLKVKEKKGVTIRNTKVLKAVMVDESNFATNKENRNSVSVLFATLG